MFVYWGLKIIQWFLWLLPAGFARGLGRFFGGLVFYVDRRHRKIALDNLEYAFSGKRGKRELRRLGRKSFSQLGFNLVEFLRAPRFLRGVWERRFRIEGRENVEKAFGRGRGIIFVMAHFGNWEYLGFAPRLLSFPGAAVGQEIKNPAVDGLVKDIRETIGLELFPKFESVSSIRSYLKRNGAVAILADQRARKMNVRVDFFGRPADTTAAPAVLVLKSGAALIPVFIFYEGRGEYRIVFEDEIQIQSDPALKEAVKAVTQEVTSVFEKKIERWPELWMWGHRRWTNN